ncbi:MAG: hypothetical protein IPL40_10320 [Proteobacteria bacterium]|nr:hypothetical protein [Pseudomonadota bacterium]
MSAIKDPEQAARSLDSEHCRMKALLVLLEGATTTEGLAAPLHELLALLRGHFSREEGEEGLHGIVQTRAPRLLQAVAPLLREHVPLADQAQRLVAFRAQANELNAALRHDVARLIEQLRQHEIRETALLQDTLLIELGSCD